MSPSRWLLPWCLILSKAIATAAHALSARHGDEHASMDEPQLPQDSDISYFQYDYDLSIDPKDTPRHGGLIIFHGLVMVANYMLLLPAIIVLRSRRHRLTWILQIAFWALNLLGWSTGRAYRRATPDLYPGSTHGKTGTTLVVLAALVTARDIIPVLMRLLSSQGNIKLSRSLEWARKARLLMTGNGKSTLLTEGSEYLPFTESTERNESEFHSPSSLTDMENGHEDEVDMLDGHPSPMVASTGPWSENETYFDKDSRHLTRRSLGSDHSTLHDDPTPPTPKPSITLYQRIARIVQIIFLIIERSLVPYAWGQALSGFCTYFGMGHTHYINGLMAHLIKGSIFWWYAILTFSRYLGAWRRWGWAWNTPTTTPPCSAAFTESLVLFLYGFSQQFMERLGAHPGDPYSAKDVEHISIAVMFWAGGLVGMAIESPVIRGWLVGETKPRLSGGRGKHSSVSVSFEASGQNINSTASNPLPAVVVGITGLAMSAHHQTYKFQVEIHALWGYLLLGFATCRCITCFLEWVRRPDGRTSTLPGLPPTELIGSIFLGAGGIAFICSDEEITLWAMRTHRDDVMMFLNLTIAFTCVAYVWVTAILLLAGKTRPSGRSLIGKK